MLLCRAWIASLLFVPVTLLIKSRPFTPNLLKLCKVPCDTLLYRVGLIQQEPLVEEPSPRPRPHGGPRTTVRPRIPHGLAPHATRRRRRVGTWNVTAVALRSPHSCLSQGISMESLEAVVQWEENRVVQLCTRFQYPARRRKNLIQHRTGQTSGRGVLLTGVIGW